MPQPDPEISGYSPGGFGAVLLRELVISLILGIALSFGLWMGKGWARTWGTIYPIPSLLFGLMWTYFTISSRLSGCTNRFLDGLIIIGTVYVFANLPNLYLATRPRVQDFFKYCMQEKEEA